jgi:NitT/TauT family transport system permease protein
MPAAAIRTGSWPEAASILLLLLAWQVTAQLADSRLFPPPLAVLQSLIAEIRDGALLKHLAITLARVAVSFVVAMAAGAALGLALGRLPMLDRWLHPWLVVLLNVPALVLIILCYVWLGLVETALLLAVALNKIPNVAVTVREGARALERDYAEVAALYRFGPWTTLRDVVAPQLAPYLLGAARNGLALIWKIVLVVELLGRSNGVGFQISLYFQTFDVRAILGYTLAFVVVMLFVEFLLVQPMEARATRWRPKPA